MYGHQPRTSLRRCSTILYKLTESNPIQCHGLEYFLHFDGQQTSGNDVRPKLVLCHFVKIFANFGNTLFKYKP